jgi:hypothetical protein
VNLFGPGIIVRSITPAYRKDKHGNQWQYLSRGDHHSKVACWALLFDLMRTCSLLRAHAVAGKVGFGINHEMRDFRTNRKKRLDLVVCAPGAVVEAKAKTFLQLGSEYAIDLTAEERAQMEALPPLRMVPVGSVHLAVEAKAAMTEHVKALPRLYDELNSSHETIHGAADFAIAAGIVLVNAADSFMSPDKNRFQIGGGQRIRTPHVQPQAAERTLAKLKELPRRSGRNQPGFDALGVVMIDLRNDGSPVSLVTAAPAPKSGEVFHYDQFVSRISTTYASNLAQV